MVQLPTEFRAQLESYRGPLDLLLFLIKRDEIDVFDIPIARIIEQYQIYIEILSGVDPNLCGEFLVMAAQLMEIKSKMLLPREELSPEGDLEDPRLELVRQLLEYKKYKERALLLEERLRDRSRRHERPRIDIEWDEATDGEPIDLGNVSIWDLFTAFHKIQLAIGSRAPHRVVTRDRPLEEYMADLRALLASMPGRTARFEELFVEARNRIEAIGYLLAILELAKNRLLVISQPELFGAIQVRLRDEAEVERLLAFVEEEPAAPTDPAEKFLLEGEGREAALEPIEGEAPAEGGRQEDTREDTDEDRAVETDDAKMGDLDEAREEEGEPSP